MIFINVAGSAQNKTLVEPEVLQYDLPLSLNQISNYGDFRSKVPLGGDAVQLLERNGFVAIKDPFTKEGEDITDEVWWEMLRTDPQEEPEWAYSFDDWVSGPEEKSRSSGPKVLENLVSLVSHLLG